MEKGINHTGSPYGHAHAIAWKHVKQEHKKAFKMTYTSHTRLSISPRQILLGMGSGYDWEDSNCQHAANKAWDLWHNGVIQMDEGNVVKFYEENNPKNCCANTKWETPEERSMNEL